MTEWNRFYKTKRKLRNRARGRCENCNAYAPTRSHHLFVRRPDSWHLQDPINIVQLCDRCHFAESLEMQVRMATKKLDIYGPERIEKWADSIPAKVTVKLPSHYWGAKEVWKSREEGNAQ